jgi:hypothetical protein
MTGTITYTPGKRTKSASMRKSQCARYAEFVESKLGIRYCTINLRLLPVHSYEQEIQTGPIKHTLEFWVESAIQLNVASVERDVHELSCCAKGYI